MRNASEMTPKEAGLESFAIKGEVVLSVIAIHAALVASLWCATKTGIPNLSWIVLGLGHILSIITGRTIRAIKLYTDALDKIAGYPKP
jgi:hypothetical protein